MARTRNIKPGFFLNDELAEIDPLGRLLFAGLWTIADREGRLEDRAKKIKAEVLPYDDCDIDALLEKLHEHGFIQRYAVEGEKYIQICAFSKHQNPHKQEKASEIPPFNGYSDTSTVQVQDKHDTSTVQVQDKPSTNPALNLKPYTLTPTPSSNTFSQTEKEKELSEVVAAYEDGICPLHSMNEKEMLIDLVDTYGGEKVKAAIRAAIRANARRLAYIEGCLKNWANGITKNKESPCQLDYPIHQGDDTFGTEAAV